MFIMLPTYKFKLILNLKIFTFLLDLKIFNIFVCPSLIVRVANRPIFLLARPVFHFHRFKMSVSSINL